LQLRDNIFLEKIKVYSIPAKNTSPILAAKAREETRRKENKKLSKLKASLSV
jgi:hypothetical protein